MGAVDVVTRRGWEIIRLSNDALAVEIIPGKGGDIRSVRRTRDGTELLWQTRWGLRARGERSTPGSSEAALMEAYPGGWQTVFPNAGDAVEAYGVTWGMHGEAWLASYDWSLIDDSAVELRTSLVRSPFAVRRVIAVDGSAVRVTESVTNQGADSVEVMWVHHPAFAPPLIGPGLRIGCDAGTVRSYRCPPASDVRAHAVGRWPRIAATDTDDTVALDAFPSEPVSRLVYLSDFTEGAVTLDNHATGVGIRLTWDLGMMPAAWYWLEAGGGKGFPWWGKTTVLAFEPASSFPGEGLDTVRRTTGNQLVVPAGHTATTTTALEVMNR